MNPCWTESKRKVNEHGYVRLQVEGKMWYAHRLAYTVLVGTIPEGYVIDHLCRK